MIRKLIFLRNLYCADVYLNKFSIFESNILQRLYSLIFLLPSSTNKQYAVDYHYPTEDECSNKDTFEEHILWAVPKRRRSVEVRRSRRIGASNWFYKLLPKRKLITCLVCGSAHEPGVLCPKCYEEVSKITNVIKKAMIDAQGLNPVEHEYVPAFKGEKLKGKDGFSEGKRIVEIPENRPTWFSKKLTQRSNVRVSAEQSPALPNPLHIKK